MTQESAFAYLRHGQTPFFRLPVATFAADGRADYRGAGAVLIGVPFDGGTTYQPGARLAPFHVRRVSALVQSYHPVLGIDVFAGVRAIDGGNVAAPPFAPSMVREAVGLEVSRIVEAGAIPFVVGGDHSVAAPTLRALAAAHGPLAVLHVDAHLDTSTAEVWGDAHHHGTPIRHGIGDGSIAKGQLHQVGIRATWGAKEDADLSFGHGGRIHSAEDVSTRGIRSIARDVADAVGDKPLYISLDVDAIDPAFAPGTGTPVPGGLTSREAFTLLRALAGKRIVGMDVVEICPPLDHADLTSHLGAHLLYEGLALAALRAREKT